MYWDIEGLVCGEFGVYWDIGFVCILGGIWDSLSYGHANGRLSKLITLSFVSQ